MVRLVRFVAVVAVVLAVSIGAQASTPAAAAAMGAGGAHVSTSVRVSFGWGIYVTYNATEVKRVAQLPINKAKYSSILCAAIPNPAMGLACGLYVYDSAASIATTFRSAAAQNRCVQTRYASPSTIIGWKVITC